jgi:HSP20 family protein
MAITDLIPWNRGKRQIQVQREERDPFLALQRDMNQLFGDFWGGSWLTPYGEPAREWSMFSPQVDVVETDTEIKVQAELPGLEEKDFEVSVSQDALTIRGEKKQEKEEKGRNYYRAERSYGSFERSISLPRNVDTDRVNAEFTKGVLTVSLPKVATSEDRKKVVVKAK